MQIKRTNKDNEARLKPAAMPKCSGKSFFKYFLYCPKLSGNEKKPYRKKDIQYEGKETTAIDD